MKLDAWQNKENITLVSGINNRPITGDLWAERLKGLHVISTCEFCEHQGKWEPIDMCNNSANKDFGCIHWSEKK